MVVGPQGECEDVFMPDWSVRLAGQVIIRLEIGVATMSIGSLIAGSPCKKITTYYLEMWDAPLVRARPIPEKLRLERAISIAPEYARFLYGIVGGDWNWYPRLEWCRDQWENELNMPGSEIWVLYGNGSPQGYVQLRVAEVGERSDVELLFFGLAGSMVGQGVGGPFLENAVEKAWSLPERHSLPAARRVWLHTCTLDGPSALPNYKARGFHVYATESKEKPVPRPPIGSWTATVGRC